MTLLGHSADPETQALLIPFTDAQHEPDAAVREAASDSLQRSNIVCCSAICWATAFMGLSLGSVLLLAALGLAITYGLLGVINMAHGEMLNDRRLQLLAGTAGAGAARAAMAGLLSAGRAAGGVSGDRRDRHGAGAHHYSSSVWSAAGNAARHLGISLMLIQLVRMLFGAQNVEVANPAWLSGGVQVLPNLILPWNRLAVLAFVLLVLCFTWLILNRTRLGMNVRAVTQNRAMAACCGVPTGRVDMLAFGLGSGIAGLGGVALSQLGNVGPELGQGYIIDSFLVVVLGGVGQLAGSVAAAFGLGIFNKILEPQMGAVLGKIADPGDDYSVYSETPAGSVRAEREGYRLMSQPITLTLAQRAPRPLRWLGILLVLGLLSMPFLALLPASHPLAVPSWLLTLSGKILCYAIVAVALESGLGLRGHAVAGARDSLCPRRVRHGDVPDAPGGGRRSAGVYVFSLLERAALVLVGHAAFRLGDGAGGAGSRSAGPGFRLVCLSLEDQRGLFLDHDPRP